MVSLNLIEAGQEHFQAMKLESLHSIPIIFAILEFEVVHLSLILKYLKIPLHHLHFMEFENLRRAKQRYLLVIKFELLQLIFFAILNFSVIHQSFISKYFGHPSHLKHLTGSVNGQ